MKKIHHDCRKLSSNHSQINHTNIIILIAIFLAIPVGSSTTILDTTIVVSKDGTGNFRTISEAIASIPDNSPTKFTVYIKKGVYEESVHIGREKNDVVLIGDGMHRTILTYNKSNKSGYGMSKTATLDTEAQHFMAKEMSFVNSAGLEAGPALALKSGGKNDAFYHCSIEGYQDTIFLVSNRKFFYECAIYGTVDFICGDARIIIQNSQIYIRRRDVAVVTAESRDSSSWNTGIVIHNCSIVPAPDAVGFPVRGYLGRPWREYSRTVVMQSYLGSLIDKEGWTKWDNATNIRHMYYREYNNRGPGAATQGRVKWPGFAVISNPRDALPFTVENFIGSKWLRANRIPFIPGLIE